MRYFINISTNYDCCIHKITATYDLKDRKAAEQYLKLILKMNPKNLEMFCFNAIEDEAFRINLACTDPKHPDDLQYDPDVYLDCQLNVSLYNEEQDGYDGMFGDFEELYYIGYSINSENDVIFEDSWVQAEQN